MSESAFSAVRPVQTSALLKLSLHAGKDQKLGDPFPLLYDPLRSGIVVQGNADLPAVIGINHSDTVRRPQPLLQGQAAPSGIAAASPVPISFAECGGITVLSSFIQAHRSYPALCPVPAAGTTARSSSFTIFIFILCLPFRIRFCLLSCASLLPAAQRRRERN